MNKLVLMFFYLSLLSSGLFADVKVGPIGGTGGTQFEERLGYSERICGVYVNHTPSTIYGIQLDVCDAWGNRSLKAYHGGHKGTSSYMPIAANDSIQSIDPTKVPIYGASRVVGLRISTKNKVSKTFGYVGVSLTDTRVRTGGSFYEFITLPKGYEVHGIFGRAGAALDALGIIYREIPGEYGQGDSGRFGNVGGGEKAKGFMDIAMGEERICGFKVRHGSRIDALQTKMCNLTSGASYYKTRHGGGGGKLSSFDFLQGESLTAIRGWLGKRNGSTRIFGLEFITSSGRTSARYGSTTSVPFEIWVPKDYTVDSITGASGAALDALGLSFELTEG